MRKSLLVVLIVAYEIQFAEGAGLDLSASYYAINVHRFHFKELIRYLKSIG